MKLDTPVPVPEPPERVVQRLPEAGGGMAVQAGSVGDKVLQLQRSHGNRYVQRMVTLACQSVGQAEGGALDPEVESSIQRARGGGQALDGAAREHMESAFGADFSGVRVHTGAEADRLNRAVSARAFTTGNDVFFRQGEYSPGSSSGRELLAHELTHVVQQNGSTVQGKLTLGPVDDPAEREADETARQVTAVQRKCAACEEEQEQAVARRPALSRQISRQIQRQTCPARPAGESTQSKTPAGVLSADTALSMGTLSHLDIMDFAVSSATLPSGVSASSDWQKAMSYIVGDPSMQVAVSGFTDCTGSDAENFQLRQDRKDAVEKAMPATARQRILFSFVASTSTYLDTNDTAEGRARNRSVRVSFTQNPATQQTACDKLTKAGNLDEYLFLVRCLESRLNLGAASQAKTALSVLRQLYYGTQSWSRSQNRIWGNVIPNAPWSPGNDPETQLGKPLMAALKASYVVEGIEVGHLFTGLDAMLNPQDVQVSIVQTGLVNEEWATWAGDVGSAAAEWALDVFQTGTQGSFDTMFKKFSSDEDLKGDVAAFAFRSGANPGLPPAQLRQALQLTGPLSEALLQYFRLTSTSVGQARGKAARKFVEAYGGTLTGNTLTNRPALVAKLRPSVEIFAGLYLIQQLGKVTGAPGSPPPTAFLSQGITAMTDLFVDWLLRNL